VGPEADARQTLVEAGLILPAQREERRLPARRVKIAPGEPLENLVAEQRR
jgi:hypothetical protein